MNVAEFLRPQYWLLPGFGPRYVQLRKRIEYGIESGILAPGTPLPPEREMATLTELSRVTIRKAIQALVNDGTIMQRQGSGSYIASAPHRIEQFLTRLTSFSEDMACRNLETEAHFLERGIFIPSPEEAMALALSVGNSVARLKRLRFAGGQPMAIECAALPLDILPDPTIVTGSLYEVLAQHGSHPIRALQKISAINLGRRDADLLCVPEHAASLKIERLSYLKSGRVIEFTRSIYRGDTYDFIAEMRLTET